MKIPVLNPFLVMAFAFPTFLALAILNNENAAMGMGSAVMAYLVYALNREINHDGKPLRIGRPAPVAIEPKRKPAIPRGEAQPHQCYICGIIDPKHSEVFGSPLHRACLDWLGPYVRIEEPAPEPTPERRYFRLTDALRTEEVERKNMNLQLQIRELQDAQARLAQANRLLRANLENYYSQPPSYYGHAAPVHPLDCPCSPCIAVRQAYREQPEAFDLKAEEHPMGWKPMFEIDGVVTYAIAPKEDPE